MTVLTQPSAPSQTCSVTAGTGSVGSANVSNVAIICATNTFTVGGTVSGLVGAGLVLRNNGANSLSINANGAFTFSAPIASGAPYAVTVLTQPSAPSQTCSITAGTGSVGSANVGNVAIHCATNTFTVGGAVNGLLGSGLVLRNNGANSLSINANGAFTFSAPIASGAPYAVTVLTQPSAPSQTCSVTAGTGSVGSANVSNVAVTCAAARPNAPTLTSSIASAYVGQDIRFEGTATDPNGFALSYLWDFGDGAGASGNVATHVYASAGTYSVRLTVFNSAGGSASGTLSQGVVSSVANAFVADCAGPNCAVSAPNTYSGSGTGVWRYANLSTAAATIDLSIGGVSQGKTVTLLFSNGTPETASSLPNPGLLAIPLAAPVAGPLRASAALVATSLQDRHDADHARMLAENAKLARSLIALRGAGAARASAAPIAPQAAAVPALNTVRVWNDLFLPGSPIPYSAAVQAVCPVANGRNVVIWLDPNAQTSGKVTAPNITAFVDSFCGNNGAFSRLTALLGDAWGSDAARSTSLIQDVPLQDVNIVILDVPVTTGWAGYFSGSNNFRSTSIPGSNEALAFFINANFVSSNLNFALSALVHEATHMINYYQGSIARGATYDSWLEETTAMMSEDIVSPTVVKNADGSAHNEIAEGRLPQYVRTGGAVSYINWPLLSAPNYGLGGSFGAYLNRRYGLSIYRQLLPACIPSLAETSYACLDNVIKNNGGLGFADEFAHFGASVFAALPATGMPAGYGYPAKADAGYSLIPIDVSVLVSQRPVTATALGADYTATTHTYQIDTIPAGKTTYVRNGVVVPANTTLLVVVK